jgi:hypothetical protein
MSERIQTLLKHGDRLFERRGSLHSLWQEIADHFYPEREGFTIVRTLGEDFAEHQMTSFPNLVRRDLGDSLSSMLRPTGKEWFHMSAARKEREDNAAKRWLEYGTGVQRRAMYDISAQFVKATKQADHDFAAFGQCVLSVELNRNGNGLLYRNWHLKDVVWCDGYDGKPEIVYRRWKPEARVLAKHFPGKLHANVVNKLAEDPYCEIDCCHIVMPAADYESPVGQKWKTPFVSIHIDKQNEHIMEEVGIFVHPYVIPRWKTVSGSQYAFSPATVSALPEARTIQAMTLTLLEAGEKATNPPLVASRDLFRDDFNYYAGGLTYADLEGDANIQDHLFQLTHDKSGINFGLEMRNDQREILKEAFYINKIYMPPPDKEMTAYEAQLRNQEFIRQTLPLFEPMEQDYNGELCERTFELLMRGNAFGPIENIPQSLRGQEIEFRFESPLHDAIELAKAQKFDEGMARLATVIEIEPTAAASFDVPTAFRDALSGLGLPATWIRSEEEAAEIIVQQREEAANQQAAQMQAEQGVANQEAARGVQEAAAAEEALNAA